ncbi:MAG TPA: A/G-specific adenine glycosylase, partial [Rectinemataceae bacterium]
MARVIPRFISWMQEFPDAASLSRAPKSRVLLAWSGLGYNRRALALHAASSVIAGPWAGILPPDEKALMSLPGVG